MRAEQIHICHQGLGILWRANSGEITEASRAVNMGVMEGPGETQEGPLRAGNRRGLCIIHRLYVMLVQG